MLKVLSKLEAVNHRLTVNYGAIDAHHPVFLATTEWKQLFVHCLATMRIKNESPEVLAKINEMVAYFV